MIYFIEIRFIKFNLTSRAYQTKSSPLEGLARPRALPRPPPYDEDLGVEFGRHHCNVRSYFAR